jgi:predicted TIM-barrel fold metal-dependent hydrolase
MIIDIHTHLGDILNPNGGLLIFRKGVRKQKGLDVLTMSEQRMYQTNGFSEWFFTTLGQGLIIKATRARNLTATLENFQRSMDENKVAQSACMPVAPHVTFDDLRGVMASDARIIPFTSVDFAVNQDFENLLKTHVADGAKGLKLHPIIQKEPLFGKRTFDVVETFAPYGLPVLFHSSVASYYLGKEKRQKQKPEYGDVRQSEKLCAAFPGVTFIVGHSGMLQYRQTIELFSGLKNVLVDTSFQSPERIKELIRGFGPERVLYASDWPFGNRKTNIACVAEACGNDKYLKRRIYFENAAELLKLSA